jgi:hypothetical protein
VLESIYVIFDETNLPSKEEVVVYDIGIFEEFNNKASSSKEANKDNGAHGIPQNDLHEHIEVERGSNCPKKLTYAKDGEIIGISSKGVISKFFS